MSDVESEIDQFRRTTGATMRAIARRAELTAGVAAGQPGLSGGEAPLPEALRLLAREVMTGEPPPPSARRLVELWRPTLDDKVRADLAALSQVLEDQGAYAKAIRRLLHDLDIDPGAEDSGQSDEDSE